MGKTESIKQRSIYVYLPSMEIAQDWKIRAKKSSASISRFIIEHVTNSLRQEEGEETYRSRAELIQQLRAKDENIANLAKENEILKLALERVENELQRYRAEPFLEKDFKGTRRYDRRLIELLKKGDTIDSDHLLHLLKINPRDTPLVKAVTKQLENLEDYGLVEKTLRGWKWKA